MPIADTPSSSQSKAEYVKPQIVRHGTAKEMTNVLQVHNLSDVKGLLASRMKN